MLKTILPITGVSALQFWLDFSKRKNPDSYYYQTCERVSIPEDYIVKSDPATIKCVASELGVSLPIHIMVSNDFSRHHSKVATFSVKSIFLPLKSFVRLNSSQLPTGLKGLEIYIASPEYCFLSFANKLPLELLAELGCNLCANYVYDSGAELSQRFRKPISSVPMIKKYVLSAEQNIGFRKACRGLSYICDGSFSPMETKLAVYSILPYSAGGHHLSGLTMNEEIHLNNSAAKMLGRDSCRGDLVWKEECVVLEYDSNMTHLTPDQHAYDKSKANALKESGYTLITITSSIANDFHILDETFNMVRKALGKRNRKSILSKYSAKRKSVYKNLFINDFPLFIHA